MKLSPELEQRIGAMLVTRTHPNAVIPTKAHPSDVGYDLSIIDSVLVEPGAMADIPHGIRVCFPPGAYGRITGRSSTIRQHGLMVIEGILDHGYTGELYATVLNITKHPVLVQSGMRLAQLIPHRYADIRFFPVPDVTHFPIRDRQEAGFGSSGV